MLLVPSISLVNGRTISLAPSLVKSQTVYTESPIDVAKKFEDHGISRLHVIDLEGAKQGTIVNYPTLDLITSYTSLKVNFTGGIHTDGDVLRAFESGAESITSATVALYSQELFSNWLISYGREKIAMAADVLDGNVRVGGWQRDTKISLDDHIQFYYDKGLKYMKTTDISRQGALTGPSFELYASLVRKFPNLCIFASGGVRDMDDLLKLKDTGVYGVAFSKAYLEGKITLKDIEKLVSADSAPL